MFSIYNNAYRIKMWPNCMHNLSRNRRRINKMGKGFISKSVKIFAESSEFYSAESLQIYRRIRPYLYIQLQNGTNEFKVNTVCFIHLQKVTNNVFCPEVHKVTANKGREAKFKGNNPGYVHIQKVTNPIFTLSYIWWRK